MGRSSSRQPGLNEKRCIVRQGLGYYGPLIVAGVYKLTINIDGPGPTIHHTTAAYLSKAIAECVKMHPILSTVIEGRDPENTTFQRLEHIDLTKHVEILDPDVSSQQEDCIGFDMENDSSTKLIRRRINTAFEIMHNAPFEDVSQTSPWKVHIVPIEQTMNDIVNADCDLRRVLVAYSFLHSHGDGGSGVAFHRTLLKILARMATGSKLASVKDTDAKDKSSSDTISSSSLYLPPALDSPQPLPISISYLLSVLMADLIPKWRWPSLPFVSRSKNSIENKDTAPWTGRPCFVDNCKPDENNRDSSTAIIATVKSKAYHAITANHIILIKPEVVKATLQQCRVHDAKLTSVIHQVITHALCTELDKRNIHTNSLTASTAINLRPLLNMSPDTMGVLASAIDHKIISITPPSPLPLPFHPPSSTTTTSTETATTAISDALLSIPASVPNKPTSPPTVPATNTNPEIYEQFWSTCRQTTTLLSKSASTLQDQPVGLLRYLRNYTTWHTSKLKQPRKVAYELSNIMTFDPDSIIDTSASTSTFTSTATPTPKITKHINSKDKTQHDEAKKIPVLEKLIFSQPGDVTGPAMSFNVVSVKNQELVVVASWQIGALGLPLTTSSNLNKRGSNSDGNSDGVDVATMSGSAVGNSDDDDDVVVETVERRFMRDVAQGIQSGFQTLSGLV